MDIYIKDVEGNDTPFLTDEYKKAMSEATNRVFNVMRNCWVKRVISVLVLEDPSMVEWTKVWKMLREESDEELKRELDEDEKTQSWMDSIDPVDLPNMDEDYL
jgi:hypothetical protein